MLPIILQHLPRDRERRGFRPVQMAGRLELTLAEYRALEAGELHISNDLYADRGLVRVAPLVGTPPFGLASRRRAASLAEPQPPMPGCGVEPARRRTDSRRRMGATLHRAGIRRNTNKRPTWRTGR